MTNAATGHAVNGRNKGWRKAVRFALTENPVMKDVLRNRKAEFELSLMSGKCKNSCWVTLSLTKATYWKINLHSCGEKCGCTRIENDPDKDK